MSGRIEEKSDWNKWTEPVYKWNVNPVDYAGKKADLSSKYLEDKYKDLIASDPVEARKRILDELLSNSIDWHDKKYKELFDMLNSRAVSFTESDATQKNILTGVWRTI